LKNVIGAWNYWRKTEMPKYEIDHTDEKSMWKFQLKTLEVADDYAEARLEYAKALKILKVGLAQEYQRENVEKKHSEDKAYLIMAEQNEDYKLALQNLIFYEGTFKGLEQVLEARKSAISFNQSLIKNQMQRT